MQATEEKDPRLPEDKNLLLNELLIAIKITSGLGSHDIWRIRLTHEHH